MEEFISHVCNRDMDSDSILEALLRGRSTIAPLLMDVNRNDLLAVAVWYVNLVGAKKGYTW
jgi:hypothetical protein